MSRAALRHSKLYSVAAAVAVLAALGGTWAYVANAPAHRVTTVMNGQHQLVQMSYHGQTGVDALTLLKRHATVQTKHYSFGDLVTSINGIQGNGPKYWTFYINGKPANVGAGAYVTKAGDTLTWKLQ